VALADPLVELAFRRLTNPSRYVQLAGHVTVHAMRTGKINRVGLRFSPRRGQPSILQESNARPPSGDTEWSLSRDPRLSDDGTRSTR
jgi:hypothetical protein